MNSAGHWIRAFAALFALAALAVGSGGADATNFTPTSSLALCAYTGIPPLTACSNQDLTAGANADMTLAMTNASGNSEYVVPVTFLPGAATIPGPETNQVCTGSADNDGDGAVNNGCPASGFDSEANRCAGASDDDPADDAAGGGSRINDGCPSVGAAETACSDAGDSDSDGFYNDGCPTVGGVEAESNAWCSNATNDDPRDDSTVNDGCPAVGSPEAACSDSLDDDADTWVNDGCPAVGAPQAEANECTIWPDPRGKGGSSSGTKSVPALRGPGCERYPALAGKTVAGYMGE